MRLSLVVIKTSIRHRHTVLSLPPCQPLHLRPSLQLAAPAKTDIAVTPGDTRILNLNDKEAMEVVRARTNCMRRRSPVGWVTLRVANIGSPCCLSGRTAERWRSERRKRKRRGGCELEWAMDITIWRYVRLLRKEGDGSEHAKGKEQV
jgi:hypothetical protein